MKNKEIIKQLKSCEFRDRIGHPLENNRAFIELLNKMKTPEETKFVDTCRLVLRCIKNFDDETDEMEDEAKQELRILILDLAERYRGI